MAKIQIYALAKHKMPVAQLPSHGYCSDGTTPTHKSVKSHLQNETVRILVVHNSFRLF